MDTNADPLEPVETARLKLRCIRLADARGISEMMTPAVSQWVASWPTPFTLQMATERITAARKAAELGSALPYAIERRSDGALLGWIGVNGDPAAHRRGSLGYWLGEDYHGHGYMREAAPAAVTAAFEMLDLEIVEAGAQPGNEASFAILRGCGMTLAGERMVYAAARDRDELCVFYEIAAAHLQE